MQKTHSGILSEHLERKNIFSAHDKIQRDVKTSFIKKVKEHLSQNPVSEVHGASALISTLRELDSVSMSIATGGWRETAQLKLESAGIDISGIPLVSSNDHYSRTEIMKLAKDKAKVKPYHRITYFGDTEWDKSACSELGYDFILVGSRIKHENSLNDLTHISQALSLIGI